MPVGGNLLAGERCFAAPSAQKGESPGGICKSLQSTGRQCANRRTRPGTRCGEQPGRQSGWLIAKALAVLERGIAISSYWLRRLCWIVYCAGAARARR